MFKSFSCVLCQADSFSLTVNSTSCSSCLANTECYGSYNISVNYGYWRSNFYSTTIVKCLNEDACVGGLIPLVEEYKDTLCNVGYGGNLCDQCVSYNGI